jgi:signal transduction histidine kinase
MELRKRNDELVASYQRMFGLREALARAQQTAAAGQTAANLAHQIGTPLNLISGYVQMMMEEERERPSGGPNLPNVRLERMLSVEEQIRKVTDVVRSTLAAVRQASPSQDPVFPDVVLRRIADVARPRLSAAGIELALQIDGELPWLMGDAVQLELALLNLLNNSLDAMPHGGTVTISALGGASTFIEVSDTGTGIPAHLVPRIFEPWVTTKPVGRGTGLGLSITREVIGAHGGTISVRSELGQGTTFTIELPGRADAPAVREV